jgi:O-antigen/teichoic acid export membrane protein
MSPDQSIAPASSRPVGLSRRLMAAFSNPDPRAVAQRDAVFVFFVRAASAAVLYLSQVVLARWMGAANYGIYVWVWTLVLILGGLSHFGLGAALVRLIPMYREKGDLDTLRGLLIGVRWLAMFSGSVIALIAYSLLRSYPDSIGEAYLLPAVLGIVCIPLFAMTDVQDGLGRAQGWLSIALVPPYVLRPVVLLVVMSFAHALDVPMDASTAVFSAIVACWAAAILQTLMVQQRLDREIPKGERTYQFGSWLRSSLPLLAVYAAELVLQNADILVLSAHLPPESVGMYFAAAKTMALVMFVHYAVGSVVAKDFAALHARGDTAALAAYARDAVKWTFWPSLIAAIGILILGQPLLWLFSPQFVEAYPVMLILGAGFLFRAAVGPAEFILNALGQQNACAAVACGVAVLDIVLNLMLVPAFGLLGAAVATATSLAVGAVLYAAVARRTTGLDISVLQLLRAK